MFLSAVIIVLKISEVLLFIEYVSNFLVVVRHSGAIVSELLFMLCLFHIFMAFGKNGRCFLM